MKCTLPTLAITLCTGTAAAQPDTLFDLSTVEDGTEVSFTLGANEVVWVSFVLEEEIVGSRFLELTTVDLIGPLNNIDTELGLYDAGGNLIANDDDGGNATASLLSFGSGSGRADLDEFGTTATAGQDGDLAAGTYYLAIGEFEVNFGDTAFGVESIGTDFGGDVTLTVFTNIPAPAPMALLGLGAAVAAHRRR